MRPIAALSLAALALCACSPGGGVKAPPRKAGLWEQTMQSDQMPGPMVTRMCLDAASDQRAPLLGRRGRRGKCEKSSIAKAADGSYVSDSVCQNSDGAKITSHAVASGDFSSHYTVNIDRTVEGSSDPDRDGEFKVTIAATYKGACPPDLKPGQMQRPDGSIGEIGQGRGGGGGFGQGPGAAGGEAPPASGAAPAQ